MTSLAGECHLRYSRKLIGFATQIQFNYVNFNATTLKFDEKLNTPFSHLFLFGNIFSQDHSFDAVTVTSSKKIVSLH